MGGQLPAAAGTRSDARLGFAYTTNLVWVKQSIGLGNWARNRHELLLVGRQGSVAFPDPEDRPDSVIEAKRGPVTPDVGVQFHSSRYELPAKRRAG
jgi:hypothetical protein